MSRVEMGPIPYARIERWGGLIGGSALVLYGLAHRKLGGMALALLGGSLVVQGATRGRPLTGILEMPVRQWLHRHGQSASRPGIIIEKVMTIRRRPEALYRAWRNLESLPAFIPSLRSVRELDERRSHWVVNAPAGVTVEWQAELLKDVENELIAWRSTGPADVAHIGLVHFEDLGPGRGTRVKVVLKYHPPGGRLGAMAARLAGKDAAAQTAEGLRAFKRHMENGRP